MQFGSVQAPRRGRRRPVAALLALVGAAGACSDPVPEAPLPAPPTRPNVILVVMDTTRADRCSFNGYARPTTPHLDALAAEGMVFSDCWSPSGWTSPAHASLFTGLHPDNHGLTHGVRAYLDHSAVTLAERFRDAGYLTAALSNNINIAPENRFDQGFGVFETLYKRQESETRRLEYPWSRETHDLALRWLDGTRDAGRPFFLFINDMEPHLRYEPPEEVASSFVGAGYSAEERATARGFEFPKTVGYALGAETIPERQLALMSDLYDAEIATLDRELGALVAGLRERGLLDDTVLVITADHGELLGEHGLVDHMFSLHRQLLHVPLILRYPPAVPAGRVAREPVRLEDVAPTLLELCGLPPNERCDGASLLGDRRGRVARAVFGLPALWIDGLRKAYPGTDASLLEVSIRSVYDGRMHYIRYSDGREELYDLAVDPTEVSDLAPAGGPVLERARRLLLPRAP